MKNIRIALFLIGAFMLSAAVGAVEPQAWFLGKKSTWSAANKPRLTHDFGKQATFADDGMTFYIGKRDNRIWIRDLNLTPEDVKVLEVHHRGQMVLCGLYLYGANESGFEASRRLNGSLPENERYYLHRTLWDLDSIPRWQQGKVKHLTFAFANSGQGSGATVYAMVFRRGKDTLLNGSLIQLDRNGVPQHWQFENAVQTALTKDFPLPVCSVSGGKSVTELESLVPEHKYTASVYLGKNAQARVIIYDKDNNVITEKKLKKTGKKLGGLTLYRVDYQTAVNVHHGELVIEGSGSYKFADAMVENHGGRLQWTAQWIWVGKTQDNQNCYFRKEFYVDDPAQVNDAFIQATCDDAFTLEINNNRIFNNNVWSNPQYAEVKKYFQKGKNVITASGYNGGSLAGFLCQMQITYKNGRKPQIIATDSSWLCRTTPPGDNWRRVTPPANTQKGWSKARSLGRPPVAPWGSNVKFLDSMPEVQKLPPVDKKQFANRKTVAKINTDLKFPRMEVNGQIADPVIYGLRWRGDRSNTYKLTRESGFEVFRFMWEFSFEAWRPDGSIDYTELERSITEFLQNHPDGKAILVMRISPPGWWQRKYPNELIKFSDGMTSGADGVFASPASEIYRKEICAKLIEAIKHIENSWYGSAFIGYMPCNLRGPEWVINNKHNCYPDYSEPMRKYFRNYLVDKYGSDAALQAAWQDPTASLNNIQIPKQSERQIEVGYFLPAKRRNAMDYTRALQQANVDTIMQVMDAIKKAAPDKLRVLYFGYLMTLNHVHSNPGVTGHYDLSRLLHSGKVDVMVSPISYVWRRPGDISGIGTVEHSFHKNNVVWLQEADNRTYLTARDDHAVTFNAADSLRENLREFVYAMIKREAIWFYDLGGDWYNNAHFPEQFRWMREFYKEVYSSDITYQTPVAFFYDEQAVDGITLGDWRWGHNRPQLLSAEAQRMIAVSGIPYDMYELEDIYTLDLSKYKVLYFQNAWRKNPRLAKFLQEKVYPAGITCIWLYAPGYGQNGGLKGMQELTGIKFELLPSDTPLQYQTPEGRLIGKKGMNKTEVFAAQDNAAQVIATYPGSGKPAAVIKNIGNGQSAWLATFDPRGELFRQVLTSAGVTPLIDKADRVLFDGKYLGVFVLDEPGIRTVTLPVESPGSVKDVISGQTLELNGNCFEFDAQVGDIRLFEVR
ncbi:MAG: hypothetical protein E7047_07975 [Lentisphaerae bacterium]|nr:hypothetical protein [Lentisphaerota bacterium]